MSTHIGTKIINAKPMTRQAYNDLRGWTVPSNENPADEGYLVEYLDGGLPNVAGFKGYVSWSPRDVFERAYRPMDRMTFGDALVALKAGHRVAREGWNGKGMFAYMVPPASYPAQTGAAKTYFGDGALAPYNAYFAIKNVNDTVSTWVPSINDCLAEDWVDLDAVKVPEPKVYSWSDVVHHVLSEDWMAHTVKYRVKLKDGAKFEDAVSLDDVAYQIAPAVAQAIVDDINRQVREGAVQP